ncbi:thiol reductant ABC exporter subunit CydC [Actinomyces dentalis]|uniref:thiol reductant ABC exporter subunit CydC n=1 Tax=Actinomyces dentalis TaxID=272548 RepID=UPI00235732DE|nr:thiol reductant ABC exporter subunit CydC [Actinomyces dentalis]
MSAVLTPVERRALRRAVRLLGLDRARFALAVLIGTLGLASAIALSGTAAWLIARASRMPDLVALGVAPVMVRLFGICRAVLRYCERLVSHDTALRGMTALRTRLYEALAASRADVVAGLRRGDVLARVGADVDAVGDLVVRAWLPAAVAAGTGALTALAVGLIHPPAGLVLGACLLLAGIAGPLVTMRSARAAELARTERAADLSAALLTALEGGAELSAAGRMPAVMEDLEDLERGLAAARDRAGRPAAAAAAVDAAAAGLAVLGGVLTGLPAVASGALDGVWLAVIVLVPLSAFEATAALGPAAVQLIASAGAAVRIVELTDRAEASAAGPARPLPPAPSGGSRLRARGLAVGWPGGPVVAEGIDLDLGPGDRLAVVGPSGIGKTTLLLTLAGMLRPRAGELTLDGASPWGAARGEVAERVSLTAEDAHVFSTSVLENLRVARGSVSRPEAAALLERAGLGPWLTALPEGLDTEIGPDATTLSGGERRRLLLARALAAPAPLMLLDEPGEHLDAAAADRLVADLLDADASRGVLLVTHRLSALAGADQVLVMGRPAPDRPAGVLRRGTHAALADHDDAYRWALSQEEQ